MKTLKFKYGGAEFEFPVETDDEAVAFIHKLLSVPFETPFADRKKEPIHPLSEPPKVEIASQRLPPDEAVMEYITSKTDFKHNLFDVQERFFGRRFSSRGKETKSMYHKTHRQLRKVHKKIEKKYGGKFEGALGKDRLKYFTFKTEEDEKVRHFKI